MEAARNGLIRPDADHPHLVFCTVADRHALALMGRELRVAGVRYAEFREPDMDGQPTALCTEPLGPDRRRLFRNCPLYNPTRLLTA